MSCPLSYSSPNAPDKRSVLGTLVLSILRGHTRYAHITSVRNDELNGKLLGIKKIMSQDSVRAAIARLDELEANDWLRVILSKSAQSLWSVSDTGYRYNGEGALGQSRGSTGRL